MGAAMKIVNIAALTALVLASSAGLAEERSKFADAFEKDKANPGTEGQSTEKQASIGEKKKSAEKGKSASEKSARKLSPVRVTVEWAGRKITVEIPDDVGPDHTKEVGKSGSKRSKTAGKKKSKSDSGKGGKTPGLGALEAALDDYVKKALTAYDADKTAKENQERVLKQAQEGLTTLISNMEAIGKAADIGAAPERNLSAPVLGPSDKLGKLD